MIVGKPGLDVSSLVRGVLTGNVNADLHPPGVDLSTLVRPSRLSHHLSVLVGHEVLHKIVDPDASAYRRMFGTRTGTRAVNAVGNESRTLDAFSSLSIEVLLEYLDERWGFTTGPSAFARRFLAVPGRPQDPPTLLVLDPAVPDVSHSRRLTDELELDPQGLMKAFDRLRPFLRQNVDEHLAMFLSTCGTDAAVDLLWVAQPEIVLAPRPRMVPLCVPSPHITVLRTGETSSVGIFCHDPDGELGVTACFHGTGPVGTDVTVDGVPSKVKHADAVQDIVFVPLAANYVIPNLCGAKGIRTKRAPSEAEPVSFEGAGSHVKKTTHVKSHDAGILRKRRTIQLKVQTPADTNTGDSGSALIDQDDCVVGFGFERTGYGEYPELTDWIWADNALTALGLKPI